MAYMGFDHERVRWLTDAMQRAVDELAGIRDDDPAARPAMARARSAGRVLTDTWLPVLHQLRSCTAMTAFRPVRLDGSDVRDALLYVLQGYGWRVTTDPADIAREDSLRVTPAEARALGALLSGDNVSKLLDTPEELHWLAGRLRIIAGDPVLASHLRANLDVGWLLAVLADEHLAARHAGVTAATTVALLGLMIGSCTAAATAGADFDAWLDGVVDELDPYAAALVVRSLDLHGAALAGLCDRIMRRWRTPPDGLDGWPDSVGPEFTADVLFPLLAEDGEAATVFLGLAASHPDVVFESTNDGALVQRLLLTGTDPAHVSAADAGAIIVPFLEWLQTELPWIHRGSIGGGFDARDLLGALVGPWLLWFGARAGAWGWTYERGDEMLRYVIDDGRAMDALIASMDDWQLALRGHPIVDGRGRIDATWLDEISTMSDQLERALADESVDDASARRWRVDVAISLGTTIARSIAKSSGVGRLGAEAVDPVVQVVQQRLTAAGWLPPDAEMADAIAEGERVDHKIGTAVVAMVALMSELIDAGDLPADALDGLDLADLDEGCDARAVRQRLLAHVEGLRDRSSAAAHNAMVAVLGTFLPPSAVNEAC